ncbi:MAG: hypothetical protein PHE50_06145 [Dehalococcoidales bacterium]|nr:hypothetical protein [Dehalococcoidales bacterium]
MIRFLQVFNYSEGVSEPDGERWYLHTHVPQVKKLPGIVRYRSWKQWDAAIPYPSAGAPTPFNQYIRRTELCFTDKAQGIQTVMENEQLWATAPKGTPGFRQIECMFLEEEEEYNLLRDAPPQHYKYMTLPLWWPKGAPAVDPNEEIFIDSYCFFYSPQLPQHIGEDWYLGHHTREGKQLPGMKHYKTWRVVRVPETPQGLIKPNKWARLTELGMSPNAFRATMCNEETRIRFTPSPVIPSPGVITGWMNISIKLDQYDDLLAKK